MLRGEKSNFSAPEASGLSREVESWLLRSAGLKIRGCVKGPSELPAQSLAPCPSPLTTEVPIAVLNAIILRPYTERLMPFHCRTQEFLGCPLYSGGPHPPDFQLEEQNI